MEFSFIVVIFLIGFVGSFVSGMVGVGGSIIKYPMLLYIPPLFGLAAFSAHEVSGISAIQVFFASIAGVWAYRKSGYLNKSLILTMGTAILIGSFIGSFGSSMLPEAAVNIVYGVLALIAAVMMFIPKKQIDDKQLDQITFSKPLAAGLAFVVGIGSGIVGAAGGFLLVPILLVVLKIPTRMTIATSLAITFISSIGGTVGKIMTGQIDYGPAAIMIVASLLAAPLGAKIGGKLNTKALQAILAVLILGTAIKTWLDIL
ncbi:sulfite exporter TauE/SafE family protein [Lysinibacillus sphaericus]|uniref:Probable membrane transporter protein n=2 Tax=Lysinibacillus TaxID=400634 RepID=A0A2S0K1J1_LYSSH|nr:MULTISPECIES: sulfite exporter TauE/SafE family protein [Lysinibacillus]AVK97262.1 anion permease [Lysinibacillus sphaericus]MCS1382190.1 sulfite exporter TauE/SafE family protein [Lysinibacillus sphaericus]MED4542565.1 sulfite exporter TauE/SafE family protein [Lysinibacillus sphaericus]TKI20049.1 sulfite exporter TauE/SafE family protein [Lysinibacillus sphaericus]TKI47635.1 sulfite exporter TauE/SafE family protein [Lysinibacillus tabacifolii]